MEKSSLEQERLEEQVSPSGAVLADPEHATILIVDDDKAINDLLALRLGKAGFRIMQALDGLAGLELFLEQRPDLVVLDIMLPKMNGWDVAQRIREVSSTPIVMLTAKGQERDEVRGLFLGADDYISKPFSFSKLLARINAALRRSRSPSAEEENLIYSDAALTVDLWQRKVYVYGKPVELRPLEFRLLACLVRSAGRVLTHKEILEQVWGPNYDSAASVKLYISYLRQRIELNPSDPKRIISVWGVGYRYDPATQ